MSAEPLAPEPGDDPSVVFGPIIGAFQVEEAVLSVLREWEFTYVFQVCRIAGLPLDMLPKIKSWRATSEPENYYEDHHPAVVVKGLAGQAVRRGGGAAGHAQTWRWELEVVTQSVTRSTRSARDNAMPQPRLVAMLYCTAFRAILAQKRDRAKLLGMIDVQGERYTSTPARAERSIHLASVLCTVEVPRVVEWGRGPMYPVYPPDIVPPTTDPTWPQVQEVKTDVDKVPHDEEP